jgi:restriction endonuclease S subunit
MICHLVLREIRDLLVPLPPITEQKAIVATIENFNEKLQPLIEHQKTCSKGTASLMPSILNHAFSGQL